MYRTMQIRLASKPQNLQQIVNHTLKIVYINSVHLGLHVFGIPATIFTITALCIAPVTITIKRRSLVYHQLPETYFSPDHGWMLDCRLEAVLGFKV